MDIVAKLLNACLFGGMCFFSFGFAPVLFKQLPVADVRPLLRGTFPYYYLAVIVLAGLAALFSWPQSILAAVIMVLICISTIVARQKLMPMINKATDTDDKSQFRKLHGLSVVVQLIQIVLAGIATVLV